MIKALERVQLFQDINLTASNLISIGQKKYKIIPTTIFYARDMAVTVIYTAAMDSDKKSLEDISFKYTLNLFTEK